MRKQVKPEVKHSEDRMLYKAGGKHEIHGGNFDYIIVDESEVEAKIKEGWFLTTTEAAEAAKKTGAKQAAKPQASAPTVGTWGGK